MSMEVIRKAVRIRLCFAEQEMLHKVQLHQGLAKSWYLVNTDVLSIGHLAAKLMVDYRLGHSCPQGVALEMGGFVLPFAQSTRILQDSDLISVRRKQEAGSAGQLRELLTFSQSVDNEEIDIAYRSDRVGLRALEEFEREAGGYQSEHSEDGDAELLLGVDNQLRSPEIRLERVKDSSRKKRKRSHNMETQLNKGFLVSTPGLTMGQEGSNIESPEQKVQKSSRKKKQQKIAGCEFEIMEVSPRLDRVEGVAKAEPERKKKKLRGLVEKSGPDINGAECSEPRETDAQGAGSSKRRKSKSVNEAADLEQSNINAVVEGKTHQQIKRGESTPSKLKSGAEARPQELSPEEICERKKSKKRKESNHEDHESTELLKKKSGEAKKSNGRADERAPEQTMSAEKKPSRSARRKKAKKRWLREQKQKGLVPKQDDVKVQQAEQPATSESETSEGEVEAEEEILPIMVAPGHIRFEPDEDAEEQGPHPVPMMLSYSEVRCKRQGQAWGQEKSKGGYFEDRSDKMEKMSSAGLANQSPSVRVVAEKPQFEKLPLLIRTPQVGDLLAYRLVELTASWTPELSTFRVGKVSAYDGTTKLITLMLLPEYPIHGQLPEDINVDAQQDEDLFLPPYNQDGTLEVDLATLMEVRVLEEGPVGVSTAVQTDSHAQKSLELNLTVDVPTKTLQPVAISIKASQDQLEPAAEVHETLNAATNAKNLQDNQVENRSEEQIEAGEVETSATMNPEDFLNQPTDPAWQDILSLEINKKKVELSAKAVQELGGQQDGEKASVAATDGVKNASRNQVAGLEDGKIPPRRMGAPIIRHRYMRTGALGPTMAMLRASQVL